MSLKTAGFELMNFDDIEPVECPCGSSRRAFVDGDGSMSIHRVEISGKDQPHRHDTNEIYYILDCGPQAAMWLDDARYAVKPGDVVKIKGRIMHCAESGDQPMTVLVVVATGHGSLEATMKFDN